MTMSFRLTRALSVIGAFAAALAVQSPAAAAPCSTRCLAPGDYSETLRVGTVSRTFLVHVPRSYRNGTSVPLVLDLHGYTSSNTQQRRLSGQLEQSDRRGFIVAWPQGLDNSWNAYGCCGSSLRGRVDDVGFLRSLVTSLKSRADVNDARVFITGLSNGGSMTHRMACEAADLFRGAAPVSFTLNRSATQCRPSQPIPVVAFHGTSDRLVSYRGGAFQGAEESRDTWAQIDGCGRTPTTTALARGSRSDIFTTCRGGVRTGLVTVANGEHVLYSNNSVDIADYIWTNVFGG